MSMRKISHIGIAVQDLERQVAFYRDVLGLKLEGIEEVAEQKVRLAVFRIGESTIELLTPTSEDSPIARFLQRSGEGIHHLAYEVEDLQQTLERLKRAGVRLIDTAPRPGAGGKRIAFLHPGATFGVLTELCE